MEFRDFAASELSALFEGLVASHSDSSLRAVRDALVAAAQAVDAAAAARPAIDQPVQDLVIKLTQAADAATQKVRSEAESKITAVNQQAEGLREELEIESARAAALEVDLDSVIEAHRQVDAERLRAQAARDEAARARTSTEDELRAARELLDAAHREVTRLHDALEVKTATNAGLEAEITAVRARVADLEGQVRSRDDLVQQLERRLVDAEAAQAALQSQGAEAANLADTLRTQAEAAAANLADTLRTQAEAAARDLEDALARADAAETAMVCAQLDLSRAGEHAALLLDASVLSLDELESATTVSDLLAAATRQLATQFGRAAMFRVRANYLEGEHGARRDGTLDVTKLSIPLSVDSLVTRAASRGESEQVAGDQLVASLLPLGGEPAAAIALPILFQGDTFAVAYADNDEPLPETHRAFAMLVARQTGILLVRMTQELKTVTELRGYATLLLQEAEQMLQADLESGLTDHERQRRLRDTIECARQLYAQRAALEGTTATGLLEEQIVSTIGAAAATPFSKDLAAALAEARSERTAS